MSNITVSIIGMGVVGSAVYANCQIDNIVLYDSHTKNGLFTDQLIETDIVFVCVDTPMQELGEQDPKNIQKVLSGLIKQSYNGIVVIKSTILYDNIEGLLEQLNVVYNPEFLTSNNAVDDMKSEHYIILGGEIEYTKDVSELYKRNFDFSYSDKKLMFEMCTIKEAIDFKYMRNIHQAWNVSFWEMMHDLGMNVNKMSMMLLEMPVEENSNISQDGYRGYGQSFYKNEKDYSACLDKDVEAMRYESKHKLLEALTDYNNNIR